MGAPDSSVKSAGAVPDVVSGVDRRFRELHPGLWDRMNDAGLRGHDLASHHAARMMVPRRSGLVVNVSSFGSLSYFFNAAHSVGKVAVDRTTREVSP